MRSLKFLCKRHKYVGNLVRKAGSDLDRGIKIDPEVAFKKWQKDIAAAQLEVDKLYLETYTSFRKS